MPIQVQCEQCHAVLRVPDSVAEKRIRCPKCSGVISVVGTSAESGQRRAAVPTPTPAARKKNPRPVAAAPTEFLQAGVAPKSTDISRKGFSNRTSWVGRALVATVVLIAVAGGVFWIGDYFSDSRGESVAAQNENATVASGNSHVEIATTQIGSGNSAAAGTAELPSAPQSVPNQPSPDVQTNETTAVARTEASAPVVSVPVREDVNSAVTFEVLSLDEPATSLTVTEDGQFVVMSHQSANMISIYDVAADKVSTVVGTKSPRALLCRGDQLYVGNFGEGTISVFSASKGWTLENELQVTKPNMIYLSAASGRNFAGEILVTCHDDGGQASYQGSYIFRLDTHRDRCDQISRGSIATVSFDGKSVLMQDSFNLSPSGGISVFPYDEFVAGDPKAIYRGGIQQTPFVYQPYAGSYWLAENMIFGGAPIALVHQDLGKMVIPDVMQKLVYVLDEDRISARHLNLQLTEVDGKPRRVEFPSEYTKDPSRLFHQHYRRQSYHLDHPVAVTLRDTLTLFLLDQVNGTVLRSRTPAFKSPGDTANSDADIPPVAATVDAVKVESPGTPPVPASGDSTKPDPVDLLKAWPKLIVAGEQFRYQFPIQSGAMKVELMDGPTGMKLTPDGVLSWTPTNADVGFHELKVRVEQTTGPYFERPKTEVVSEELAKSVGGDLSKVNRFQTLELDVDHYAFVSGVDRKSLLLLQGKTLRTLGSDGITIDRTVELPQRYHDIEERADVYVAVSSQPPFVDIVDRKSLKVRKHIDLKFTDFTVQDVTDLAIHPDRPQSFVCVKFSIELPRYTVLIVDEQSGAATAPGIVGTWAEVDPEGRNLYTGYRDIYEKGVNFHINPGWRLIEIPEYGNVDMLMTWNVAGTKPSLRHVVRQAGGNGNGIRVAPDASRIIYLSHVGTPMHSNNLLGFSPQEPDSPAVNYETKDRASTKEAAFHPHLPWVVMPGTGSVTIFHKDTGAIIENRLLATHGGLGTDPIDRLFFSPDGRSLLLLRGGGESGRYFQRVPLILEAAEKVAASSTQAPRVSTKAKPKKVPVSALGALQAEAATTAATPLEIGRDFTDSVVIVQTDGSAGTGFLVGADGYVLTCAHVLDGEETATVSYNLAGNPQLAVKESAVAIRVDPDLDLALLHFEPKHPLKSVRFRGSQPMETGEPVTVIGNPGAGDEILNHTMTNGIVSNPNRILDGQSFIQLSAAINPGNSGGPLFDQHGNVAGLISLKANIEGAGFAVPSDTLKEFLKAALKAP